MSMTNVAAEALATAGSVPVPPSLSNNLPLYGWNLFVMTAALGCGLMMAGKQAKRMWACRHVDHPRSPVTIYRLILFVAGLAVFSRGGVEALSLWSWSSHDPHVIANIATLKRWIDPLSIGCGFIWMSLATLADTSIEFQLKRMPLPTDLMARWPTLKRPAAVLGLSMVMALAAVTLG